MSQEWILWNILYVFKYIMHQDSVPGSFIGISLLPQSKINSYFGNILHCKNSQEACNAEQLAEPNASDRSVSELCMASSYSTTPLNPL